MRTTAFRLSLVAFLIVLGGACGDETSTSGNNFQVGESDAGLDATNVDDGGNVETDSGALDTGSASDMSSTGDMSSTDMSSTGDMSSTDMGSSADMGSTSDTGMADDMGSAADTGSTDMGTGTDAGMSLLELGEGCSMGSECDSSACYQRAIGGGVCSICETDGDCAQGSTCDYSFGDPYARCVGQGALGDACAASEDCGSGFCQGGVCSECEMDLDCGEGGACIDDSANSGYYVCLGAFGELCSSGSDCGSGSCYDTGFASICSECGQDGDCAAQQSCNFQLGEPYATCGGTLQDGDACNADLECESAACNTTNGTPGVCSECNTDADCEGGGSCVDDTANSGFFVCEGGLGEDCSMNTDCNSGFCYTSGPMFQQSCSLCSADSDCASGQTCMYSFLNGYADCN